MSYNEYRWVLIEGEPGLDGKRRGLAITDRAYYFFAALNRINAVVGLTSGLSSKIPVNHPLQPGYLTSAIKAWGPIEALIPELNQASDWSDILELQ